MKRLSRETLNKFGHALEWAQHGSRGDIETTLNMASLIQGYVINLEQENDRLKNVIKHLKAAYDILQEGENDEK